MSKKITILTPSRLMRVKPKTRFEYFRRILKGEMVYKPSVMLELREVNRNSK